MEEFRVLYSLVTFRMASLDRRIAIAWAGLGAFVGSFLAANEVGKYVLLLSLPPALVWLLRTTVNHARSFEDVLRRIDEIERAVNGIADENLLAFQSRHPSRFLMVGGRTGMETVHAVYVTCLVLLVASSSLFALAMTAPVMTIVGYGIYAMLVATLLFVHVRKLRAYRYEKRGDSVVLRANP